HPAGFGQNLDRLKPFGLGQLDLLDESVQILDEAEHDLTQPRVGGAGEALQYLGCNIVFCLVTLGRHLTPRLFRCDVYDTASPCETIGRRRLINPRSPIKTSATVRIMNTILAPNTQRGAPRSMIQPNSIGPIIPPVLRPMETIPNARPTAPA